MECNGRRLCERTKSIFLLAWNAIGHLYDIIYILFVRFFRPRHIQSNKKPSKKKTVQPTDSDWKQEKKHAAKTDMGGI